MSVSIEVAAMAAEHTARESLLRSGVDVRSIVLTVGTEIDGATMVASSCVPMPSGRALAQALHASAVEAGWTTPEPEPRHLPRPRRF